MRRWVAVLLSAALPGLLAVGGGDGGCHYFNRMGISPDGNTIAFSLNGEGGFAVDDSSAVYALDLTTCRLTRVSADKTMATAADINAEGEVAFNWLFAAGGEGLEVAVWSDGEVMEVTRNRDTDWVPQWLDSERLLLATSAGLGEGDDEEEYEVRLSVFEDGDLRTVVRDYYSEPKRRFYWSTLPVWRGDLLAYAAAQLTEPEAEGEEGEEPEGTVQVHLYLVAISTGERRELTSLTFPDGGFGEKGGEPGFVDLAFSPDGKKLAACFLPLNPEELKEDQRPSRLYLIDVATGEKRLVRDDVNMYYPRFAPRREGEPYRLLYLSGTGEEGRGRSLNILDLETGESRKVLSLPGKIMAAYTDWRWLSELAGAGEGAPADRLRVYHLSDLGLIVAEVDEDGSDLEVRYLDADRLRLAQVEADLRWARQKARESAEGVAALEKVLSEVRARAPGPVEFVRVKAVPRPQEPGEGEK